MYAAPAAQTACAGIRTVGSPPRWRSSHTARAYARPPAERAAHTALFAVWFPVPSPATAAPAPYSRPPGPAPTGPRPVP
ncbi:MAG: hypothetical protein N6V49_00845 [Serratia symbiotica]|nr:hypothetical protein [Serratia symbiotica]